MSLLRKTNQKFGELAVKKGLISQLQLEAALREQKEFRQKGKVHKKIGAILVKKGILELDDVYNILKEQYRYPILAWLGTFFSLK